MSRARRSKAARRGTKGRRGHRPASAAATRAASKDRRRSGAREDLAAEALTVMWMLTAVATLAAQLVAAAAWGVQMFTVAPDAPATARIIPGWFLFCAAVTGVVCLAITPVVYVLRRRPPPTPVTVATVVICLLPWIVVFGRLAR